MPAFEGSLTPRGIRRGSFVTTGTHTPHRDDGVLVRGATDLDGTLAASFRDLRKGNLYVDILRDAVVSQTLQAAWNLRATLEEFGSGLGQVVHLRVFVADMVDEAFVLQTLQGVFGRLPSGQIVRAVGANCDTAIRVYLDALAVPFGSGLTPLHVDVAPVAALVEPFASVTQVGPYLFTSCFPGFVQPGEPARYDALDEPARRLLADLPWCSASQRPFLAQQAAMWSHARRVLQAWDAPLESVVHHFAWLGVDMRQLGNGSVTRMVSPLVKEYCLTCFPVAGMRQPGCLIDGKYIALDPASRVTKDVRLPRSILSNSYFNAIGAGELVFTAGEVPIDLQRGALVTQGADHPRRPGLDFGLLQANRDIVAQAAWVYDQLTESLGVYGLAWADVVHQTMYLCDAADHPALLNALQASAGSRLVPPTSIAPITGASPFPRNRLEVEVIASRAEPSQ